MQRDKIPAHHVRFLRCIWLPLSLAILLLIPTAAHAQGCSMCRDTTAGSSPQIRAALRLAIPVLAIPALGLFIAFFVVARRIDTMNRIAESRRLDDDR